MILVYSTYHRAFGDLQWNRTPMHMYHSKHSHMHPRVHARTHARTHALTHTVPDEVWVGGGGGGWGVPKEQIMYTQERTSSDSQNFIYCVARDVRNSNESDIIILVTWYTLLWSCSEYVSENCPKDPLSAVNKCNVNTEMCLILTVLTWLCLLLTVLCLELWGSFFACNFMACVSIGCRVVLNVWVVLLQLTGGET